MKKRDHRRTTRQTEKHIRPTVVAKKKTQQGEGVREGGREGKRGKEGGREGGRESSSVVGLSEKHVVSISGQLPIFDGKVHGDTACRHGVHHFLGDHGRCLLTRNQRRGNNDVGRLALFQQHLAGSSVPFWTKRHTKKDTHTHKDGKGGGWGGGVGLDLGLGLEVGGGGGVRLGVGLG
jgi:hypothetical protein